MDNLPTQRDIEKSILDRHACITLFIHHVDSSSHRFLVIPGVNVSQTSGQYLYTASVFIWTLAYRMHR